MINDRIQQIINEHFAGNVSAFCRAVGVKQPTMNTIIGTRRSKPSYEVIEAIINAPALGINADWLVTGRGAMQGEQQPRISYTKGVPYYNVDFIGGFDLVANDQTTLPQYYIDFEKYNKAELWCNITGHSMEPAISHGDIIALKEIKDWQKCLMMDEIYAIVTKNEQRTVKIIKKGKDDEHFTLVPINKDFDKQDISIDMIDRVFKVLGCMKRL